MKIIPLIWLIFTFLFACFSVYHYFQSKHYFPRFQWETVDSGGVDFDWYSPSSIETRQNFKNYIKQWNDYIEEQNNTSRTINRIASITYFVSSVMAFVAMILPGPYNIQETKNYLYGKCNKSSMLKRLLGKLKPDIKTDKDHKT
ncbi:MAG: hypothetical protein JRC93_09890 [Deltaproteobacteria bacterium]|nr:hypothetical protein [Deltaproteobacteria bacterium]